MKKRTIVLVPLFALAAIALSACGGGKSSNANSSNTTNTIASAPAGAPYAGNQKIPNCGAVQAVWVNLNTKVYHEPGDPAYGHTKRGEYLCPSQAAAEGFRRAGEGTSSGGTTTRHHRRHAAGAPEQP